MKPSTAKPLNPGRKWKKGQTMTEYVMILATVALTVSVAFNLTGRYTDQLVDHASRLLVTQHGDG